MLQMLSIGMLFIMGVYYLVVYSFQRKNLSMLFFGLFCLAMTVRTLLVGDILLLTLYNELDWTVLKKLEYLSENVSYIAFVLFLRYLFPYEINKAFVFIAILIGTVFSLIVLVTSIGTFTSLMPLMMVVIGLSGIYLLYVYLTAAIKKREGALIGFIFAIICFMTIMNDYLHHNEIIQTMDLLPYGFSLFLLAQIIIISMNYSHLFKKVDSLTYEVYELNQSLENKLAEDG
ncbi:7TM diverse intracellular signaling domain-containing protein [Bacillus sp. FJAT-45350]|uniref:7TM diverse intracellular signaling domain-containing protein n=1 Tax=Bacillus sp. FJAT-45350 TaxID=2011014 RepID=UPI000BB75C51|nr:7TM diverse intracellular signaling domain-containing protein [Bacillus sp. FJAT-45350]